MTSTIAHSNSNADQHADLNDTNIYLLMGQAEYQHAKVAGALTRSSLDSEGFIHACAKSQLARVSNKHYVNVADLLVLSVQKDKVSVEIKWEPATGGLYPHIYGPMNMDAVVNVESFQIL